MPSDASGDRPITDFPLLIQRARELAARAQNPSLSANERSALNSELGQIGQRIAPESPTEAADSPVVPPTLADSDDLESDELWEDEPALDERDQGRFIGFRALLVSLTLGFLLGLIAVIGLTIWRAHQSTLDVPGRIADLRRTVGQEPGLLGDGGSVPMAISGACDQAASLDQDLRPVIDLAGAAAPASPLIGQVPQVGERASAMVALGQAAGEITTAVRIACEALDPVASSMGPGQDGPSTVASLITSLGGSRERIREASARLRSAHAQLALIDPQVLDERTQGFLVEVRDRLPAASARLALLAEIPGLLGHDGARSYLVLGQNSDELRPTGGFIGTSGTIIFDRGRLQRYEYGSSFNLAVPSGFRVPPPEPLQRFMAASYWQFWEANWWPDFPSTAQQARYFYELSQRKQVAGVLAIDQDVIALMLDVTGPVEVREYGELISAENVRDRLVHHVHDAGYPDPIRKNFVTALFTELMARLNTLPRERVSFLVTALDQALREQHLQVWVEDAPAEQNIGALGWDGRMLEPRSDYLFVVSANVSANKVNREVEQSVDYEVEEDADHRLFGRLTLHLRNRRPTNDPGPYQTADYRDFIRIYVPLGSELLAVGGFDSKPEVAAECGLTAFSGLIVVAPGEERVVELRYRLAPSVQAGAYSALVQKQAGTRPYPFRIRGLGMMKGEVAMELRGHQAVAIQDGTLVPSTWNPSFQPSTAERRCEIHTERPLVLAPPSEIAIPRIGVRAEMIGLGVDANGALGAPTVGSVVGWYEQSARPGQGGNMVASGHLDWDNVPAVFWRLQELVPGDRILVRAKDGGQHEYTVDWIRRFPTKEAPLGQVLGPTTERWLTLITCGGTFDRTSRDYSHRVVVRAKLAGSPRA